MTLTEIIQKGMNNPECAFYVGSFFGNLMAFKWLVTILAIGFIYKAIDKLAWSPLIEWIKKKLYKN